MTVIINREALLRVLSREPSLPSSSPCEVPIPDHDEFVLVDIPKPLLGEDSCDRTQRGTPCDDDRSLCTLSTDSLSTDSTDSIERRVSFADPLVTQEWARPWTPREEVSKLFYSTEETQRFRQEYRLERKLANDLSVDPESLPLENQELTSFATSASPAAQSSQPCSRHRISRVVVLHNDKLETFFNPDETLSILKPSVSSNSGGDDFFDNDSFWSGSLTWY